MLRFSVLFMALIIGLFLLEIYEPMRQAVILPFTSMIASFCSWVIQIFDSNVIAQGDVIRDAVTYQGIQIAPGCNGVEAMIILLAAVVAFPLRGYTNLKVCFMDLLLFKP
ncbi:MAG: archaeosortase/exosortase family protein [Marinicella sp.]